jgi:hypothetical protein
VESGNDEGGTFQLTGWIPPYSQDGTWTLRTLSLEDNAGNVRSVPLASLSGAKSFTVTGTGDTTAPTFTDLVLTPDPVDATDGDLAAAQLTARSTDDLSGVAEASVDLVSPSGRQYSYDYLEMAGGWQARALDVQWTGQMQLPRNAESGEWSVSVYAEDNSGNALDLTGTALTAAGLPATITVNGVADATAPALVGLEITETAVDSRTQDRYVMFLVHATDAVSGVDQVHVDMGNGQWDDVYLYRVGGTSQDGWYVGSWRVTPNATPGSRPITVRLTDDRGNIRTLSSSQLSAASLPSAIDVTSNGVAAPDGVIKGVVSGPAGPVANAFVQACNETYDCGSDTTDGTGAYEIIGLPGGDYDVDVYPPSGLNQGAATVQDLYAQPNRTATRDVTLTAPAPLPSGTSVDGQTSGIPSVVYNQSFTLKTEGCPDGTATYTITQGTSVLQSGPMTEGPPGTYTATVPALGSPGSSTVSITIDCPVGVPDSALDFSLYIDPSGFVYDHDGTTPVPGAQVVLYRSDTENGTYTQVPDGSTVMSPENRTNPDVTDSTGHYGWLTIKGWYRVDVTKAGCYQPGSYDAAAGTVDPVTESRIVKIPPEVTDLHVTIDCRNKAPKVSASRTGGGSVVAGTSVAFSTAGTKDPNGTIASYAWDFGDGTSGSGASPSHSYTSTGTFTPKVTVTDDQGASTTVDLPALTVTTPVSPPPPPPAPPAPAVDTSAPTSFLSSPTAATSLAKTISVTWGGADDRGVTGYDVRYRSAAWNKQLGGYVSPAALQNTDATSAAVAGSAGSLYCFSVRARDAAGNTSAWSAERCTAKPLDDTSLTAKGAWKTTKGKSFYGGTTSTSTAKGATLTKTGVLAGRIALVATKGKGMGQLGVYYNGKLVQKVKLAATRTVTKSVIALPKFTTKKGTVVLKVLKPGKGVQIDGLVSARK